MVGVIDDVTKRLTSHFKNDGDQIALLGENLGELGASEYLKIIHDKVAGKLPDISLDKVKNIIDLLVDLADNELINSAHDISDGGFAVALAECCFGKEIGAEVTISSKLRSDAWLFGESRPLVIISFNRASAADIGKLAKRFNVPLEIIGKTGGSDLIIDNLIKCSVAELKDIYESAIPNKMETISH
jgi:phosphoribosylformylglycinamidine synthase